MTVEQRWVDEVAPADGILVDNLDCRAAAVRDRDDRLVMASGDSRGLRELIWRMPVAREVESCLLNRIPDVLAVDLLPGEGAP